MNIELRLATINDIDGLVSLVGSYHTFESIQSGSEERRTAIQPLLLSSSDVVSNASLELGFILVAEVEGALQAYLAVCFGYSLEFGGKDAFIDELYVREAMRNKGIGSMLLERSKQEAKQYSVKALHLEVERDNQVANKFYQKQGFSSRESFHLMSYNLK